MVLLIEKDFMGEIVDNQENRVEEEDYDEELDGEEE